MISAIVLAAGKSERMGRPKALLPIGHTTFLQNILDAISRSGIGNIIVVAGHHRDEIVGAVQAPVVFNPDYEKGMVTSIQAGIRALPAVHDGAMLFLVDHPIVAAGTIRALMERSSPDRIVLPVFAGRRGHPVLFGAELLHEILDVPDSQGANVVVRKDPGRIIEVPVETSDIHLDIDTPEQYRELMDRFLRGEVSIEPSHEG